MIEREHYLRVVAMSAAGAKAFAMPDAVRAICAGQADPQRYRFGARVYYLVQTWADYQTWLQEDGAKALDRSLQEAVA